MDMKSLAHGRPDEEFLADWPKGGQWGFMWVYGGPKEWPRRTPKPEGKWVCVPMMEKDEPESLLEDAFDLLYPEVYWPGYDTYKPSTESPNLYLEFADLGRAAREAYGGLVPRRESSDSEVPEPLASQIMAFYQKNGPLVMPSDKSLHWDADSIREFLYQAQLIELAVTYRRVVSRESPVSALVPLEKVFSAGIGLDENPSDEELLRNMAGLLEGSQNRRMAIEGVSRPASVHPTIETPYGSEWRYVTRFMHLSNVIWAQAIDAIVTESSIRECGNSSCSQPGKLFVRGRANQDYCSVSCRDLQNTRIYRSRRRKRQSGRAHSKGHKKSVG